MDNTSTFFEACERGNAVAARNKLEQLDLPSLIQKKTLEGRTCSHMAVIAGNQGLINIIEKADERGDTALHLAVSKNRVDLMKQLVDLDANLCEYANNEGETPLKLAVSLVSRGPVEFLITRTSNALHYIVELNQAKLVEYLIKKTVNLSELINRPYCPPTNPRPENEGNGATIPHHLMESDQPVVQRGDTPLHVAARNKYESVRNFWGLDAHQSSLVNDIFVLNGSN